jgi:hypothetical protein
LAQQEEVDWILELKAFLVRSRLPEDESEAKRIVRHTSGYCIKELQTIPLTWPFAV